MDAFRNGTIVKLSSKYSYFCPQICIVLNLGKRIAVGNDRCRNELLFKMMKLCDCECSVVDGTLLSVLSPFLGSGNITEEGTKIFKNQAQQNSDMDGKEVLRFLPQTEN